VSRPVPEFTISLRQEGEPEPRLIAFTESDLERLKDWLRRTPALVDVAQVALLVLDQLLAEERCE
jgi:hypothetical protein